MACGNGVCDAAWHSGPSNRARRDQAAAARRVAPAKRYERIFDGYNSASSYVDAFDEMFDGQGNVRGPYKGIYAELAPSDASDLEARAEALSRAFSDQGITFSLSGQERPFPLDLVPRVISAAEWTRLERGITQRVKALECYLDDVYGDQEILNDGVIPRRLVTSCEHFYRQAAGIVPPNGVRIHVAGIDLIRDEKGSFRVLEDNLRSPSGVSYVIENRRTMARVFPNLFATHRVRAVDDYAAHLLRALRKSAATNEADPTVVVLTPGVHNSAYFEHSLLARQMGVELVEGRDLFCRDNQVYMRTTEGERQVDVIYRRIDDAFLDPMQFRPNSVLGVAGLLNAARAGNVVISSAVGNGVGDDKLVYTYVPTIIEYYLGEKPLLANVDTFRCWLDDEREEVLDRVGELVIKPVEGSGGYGIVFGPEASNKELDRDQQEDPRRSARLDRPTDDAALDGPDKGRRQADTPLRRLATVRGQRRPRRVGVARRPDPGGTGRRIAGGELQPGRRLQGHLGAGVARLGGRPRAGRRPDRAVAAYTGHYVQRRLGGRKVLASSNNSRSCARRRSSSPPSSNSNRR